MYLAKTPLPYGRGSYIGKLFIANPLIAKFQAYAQALGPVIRFMECKRRPGWPTCWGRPQRDEIDGDDRGVDGGVDLIARAKDVVEEQ